MKREDVAGDAPVLQALGLCAKAGRLVFGVPMICEMLKKGKKPFLVLTASDNAQNTAKRLRDRCAFYAVPLIALAWSGEELARAVGKSAHLAAVAVTDENLSVLVAKKLQN
ncbi:MAG: ribosomal L7Ae/L30e/S12e/Gadd45 family protein [Clostridia bacterium]|nr:ribosomal L7Ae/L30e/S12e/Gadd45 family protein [Clostridia bacterium]